MTRTIEPATRLEMLREMEMPSIAALPDGVPYWFAYDDFADGWHLCQALGDEEAPILFLAMPDEATALTEAITRNQAALRVVGGEVAR